MIPTHAIPGLSSAKRDDIRPAVSLTRETAPAWLMPADRDGSRPYDRRAAYGSRPIEAMMPEGPARADMFMRLLRNEAARSGFVAVNREGDRA